MRLPLDQNFPELILSKGALLLDLRPAVNAMRAGRSGVFWLRPRATAAAGSVGPVQGCGKKTQRGRREALCHPQGVLRRDGDSRSLTHGTARHREAFAARGSDLEFGPYPDGDPESNDEGAHNSLDGGSFGQRDACVPRCAGRRAKGDASACRAVSGVGGAPMQRESRVVSRVEMHGDGALSAVNGASGFGHDIPPWVSVPSGRQRIYKGGVTVMMGWSVAGPGSDSGCDGLSA